MAFLPPDMVVKTNKLFVYKQVTHHNEEPTFHTNIYIYLNF